MIDSAIILAAGYGSRLRERSDAKPLTPVCGIALIEIAVHQAVAAGIRKLVVVTGHNADRVEAQLSRLSRRLDVEIACARLDDWSKPNGWSVIAGARHVAGPFLLMMADHIFADGLLEQLAEDDHAQFDVVLATDRVDNPLIDPDDATWVQHGHGRRIRRIGKALTEYDVVDCGAFRVNARLPEAIEAAITAGKAGSLSDGMQVLANRGRAATMDIGGAWWIDVDDPRALELAQAQVADHLALFGKGGKGGTVGTGHAHAV